MDTKIVSAQDRIALDGPWISALLIETDESDSLPIGERARCPELCSCPEPRLLGPPRAAQAVADSTFHRDKLLSCACLSIFRYLSFSTKYSHPASHPLVKTIYTRIRIHRTRAFTHSSIRIDTIPRV